MDQTITINRDLLRKYLSGTFAPTAIEHVIHDLDSLQFAVSDETRIRIQFAVALLACNSPQKLDECIALARRDWRDVLIGSGLGYDNWREVLTRRIGALVPPLSNQ